MSAVSSIPLHPDRIAVALPACNEAAVIERCLDALAAQTCGGSFAVLALLNNCSDATADIVKRVQPKLPYRLFIEERWFDEAHANAGVARRTAMLQAGCMVDHRGLLLTTDADSYVAPDWIEANVAEINAGADAVAGMALIDPVDAALLPARLMEDEAKTELYANQLDEMAWLLDEDAADPWPRHTEHSGASIAVRADWHLRVGGMPSTSLGEDRQFFAELRREDARIRHSRNVTVTVSGRVSGRAKGGMADTIFRRLQVPDLYLDDRLEPAEDWMRRVQLRAELRAARSGNPFNEGPGSLANAFQVPVSIVQQSLTAETFGRGWNKLERVSPVLRRQMVPAADLDQEIQKAAGILQQIRLSRRSSARAHQADTADFVAAE